MCARPIRSASSASCTRSTATTGPKVSSRATRIVGFTPIERSLAPTDCGTCHAAQYQDWQDSIHARSLGPGVAGRIIGALIKITLLAAAALVTACSFTRRAIRTRLCRQ